MKKILSLILLIIFLSSCVNSEKTSNPTGIIDFNIIQMNDIHGHVQDYKSMGGMAAAGYVIDKIRNEDNKDNTIVIGNGDMLQETAISRVNYGRVVIDTMSEIGFDMMGIGNHEFDWGLDKFLAYFDGEESNGEASFPLINSNIYFNNELVLDDNIFESLIIEKEQVKIGILSYIGDVYNSINANMTEGYSFKSKDTEIAKSVSQIGAELKSQGAEIIIVNIHDGSSDGINKYNTNKLLSQLKYNDEYLVDAVINGHTHTEQKGAIVRTNGAPLQVVQSAGGLNSIGRINLKYSYNDKMVISSSSKNINISKEINRNSIIDDIVNKYYNESKDILEEIYCENNSFVSRYDESLYWYAANIMMKATGATAAICNTGAFRNNVNVGPFNFDALYALNPFDNHIIICTINGADLQRFYDKNKKYEFCFTKEYGPSIAVDKTYKLAIVDYVYFGSYFQSYRDGNFYDTELILRDLFAADLRLRKNEGFNVNTAYKNIKINEYSLN